MPNIKIILTNPVSLDFTDKTNNALRKKIDFERKLSENREF